MGSADSSIRSILKPHIYKSLESCARSLIPGHGCKLLVTRVNDVGMDTAPHSACTIREEFNRVVERLKAENATRKFGGEYKCVGDAN